MTRKKQMKGKSGGKLSQEQQDALRSDAHAYLRFARNTHLEVKEAKLDTLEALSERKVVWTNTGFAFELMLKWVLYCDREELRQPAHYIHKLFSIYTDMSPKAQEAVEKMYSGEMSYAMQIGVSEFQAQKVFGKPPVSTLQLPDSYHTPIRNLPDMLKYIDKHKLLYDKRYSSVLYNSNEWNMFMTGLDHLFSFINGLARLIKLPNGNWGYKDGLWTGHGLQEPRLKPEEIRKFYARTRWETDEEGRWTQMTPNGRIVVYCPEEYANHVNSCGEYLLTKGNPYLHVSIRNSREGSYSKPSLVAKLIVYDN